MIDVINLEKIFSDKILFKNVNLSFKKGNTYGIIGANGAGKSTFLKMIYGEQEITSGQIIIEKDKRLSVLSQDHSKFDGIDATNVVIMGNKELWAINEEKNSIYMNPDSTPDDYAKAADLEDKYGQMGGWEAENNSQMLLSGIGVSQSEWNKNIADLKSNEKVKVLLAQALFGNPDILILDEPTNHLDLKAIKWLENFLADYENLILVVSHDSDFLDQVSTHTVDIDFEGAKMYTGNYSFWKGASELAAEMQSKENSKKEDQVKKLQEFIKRFSANASKSKQATSRKKLLDKIVIDDFKPTNRKYPYIRWGLNRVPGKDLISVENLTYINEEGKTLFQNLNFSINKMKEKMVIIGEDDIAKTKLLQILAGEIQPTSGSVKWGQTITKNYFPNNNDAYFNNNESLLEWISKWPLNNIEKENKENDDQKMRGFLGRMFFTGDSVKKKARDASGGEKARLIFSKMMIQESNFLLLDQPLDHLDTESIESVIEAVKEYKSSAIFTTYNRTMVRECANIILEINPNESLLFKGTLEEFEEKMGY
ncbi:MAG: ATP-binding cassette domain-containing protein [Mollicutes bacterium PWAP]|nr:ATP-binding cassette domain-containing protein [Mollicutes bacterium PWAP]